MCLLEEAKTAFSGSKTTPQVPRPTPPPTAVSEDDQKQTPSQGCIHPPVLCPTTERQTSVTVRPHGESPWPITVEDIPQQGTFRRQSERGQHPSGGPSRQSKSPSGLGRGTIPAAVRDELQCLPGKGRPGRIASIAHPDAPARPALCQEASLYEPHQVVLGPLASR